MTPKEAAKAWREAGDRVFLCHVYAWQDPTWRERHGLPPKRVRIAEVKR